MTRRNKSNGENEAQMDELGNAPGEVGSDSAGQSGDSQGLSEIAGETDESVQELAETGQSYEAEVVEGLEDAADHPEKPARTHEERGASWLRKRGQVLLRIGEGVDAATDPALLAETCLMALERF